MLFLVAIPAWKQAGGETSIARLAFYRLLRRLLVVCLVGAVASGLLWYWLSIAGMSGSSLSEALQPGLFWMVLTQTQPGHVWAVRAGFAVVLAIALFLLPRAPREWKSVPAAPLLCAGSATALTASLAWLGHAGAGEGPNQNLQLAGDLLHLLAAGIWPAGLVPFALFLRCFLQARDPASLETAGAGTRRFSALSLATVAVLTLSGVVNSYFLVGSLPALVSTEYGRLLMLKLALFAATIGIGAWNLILTPRTVPDDGPSLGGTEDAALSKIVRNVLIEIGLVTIILLVVGLLGISAPAIHS